MNTKKTLDFIIEKVVEKYPDVSAIYLFGSFGTPYETAQSDIDIALMLKQPVDKVELWNFAQKIASALNRDVELIDLWHSSTVFRYQVIGSGKRIFCQDQKSCDFIETAWMSMYLRFNEERKEFLPNN